MKVTNICKNCGQKTVWPCTAANDNYQDGRVIVACDELLKKKSHNRRLCIFYMSRELPRLQIPNWINNQICGHLWRDRKIYWPDGSEFDYDPGMIDDAFNNDPGFRAISEWFESIRQGGPFQKTSKCSLDWHRLFTLAVTIYSSEIARKIAK